MLTSRLSCDFFLSLKDQTLKSPKRIDLGFFLMSRYINLSLLQVFEAKSQEFGLKSSSFTFTQFQSLV